MKGPAEEILVKLIDSHADKKPRWAEKWENAKFGGFKKIPSATTRGSIGEQFAAKLLAQAGYMDVKEHPKRRGPWDICIGGKLTLEVKTASEDVGDGFQFNGLSYRPPYDILLLIGIQPEGVLFAFMPREQILKETLTPMSKGSSGSYKLARRRAQLLPIDKFAEEAAKFLGPPSSAQSRPENGKNSRQ